MGSTSIGTGGEQDRNENQPTPADPWPSRTLGADAPQARPKVAEPPLASDEDANSAEVVPSDSALSEARPNLDHAGTAFPEGPNVAPSPWEVDAARGRA